MAKSATPISEGTPVELLPWAQARTNEAIASKVRTYKKELEAQIINWGKQNGIENLSLAGILTLPENPNAKVSIIWRADKQEWFRYREGDAVPSWLGALGKSYKDYLYPDGKHVTPEMKAKYRGRGSSKDKATSLDDL